MNAIETWDLAAWCRRSLFLLWVKTQIPATFLHTSVSSPKRLGGEWGLPASPYVEVTFEISLSKYQFSYAILSEGYDNGYRLGISISKVIDGVRKQ